MTALGSTALFWTFALLCALFAGYLEVQMRSSRDIAIAEQRPFSAAAPEVAHVSFDLDPRALSERHREIAVIGTGTRHACKQAPDVCLTEPRAEEGTNRHIYGRLFLVIVKNPEENVIKIYDKIELSMIFL